jgi:hypothetical protein
MYLGGGGFWEKLSSCDPNILSVEKKTGHRGNPQRDS